MASLRDFLFYEEPGVTLYCGDCREILPYLTDIESVITDPVWPNAHPDLLGSDDPVGLFAASLTGLPDSVKRLVVWLGCQSDPRFLHVVPSRWPFLRLQYLRRAVPSYNGRCLVTGDVVYAFGEWPPSTVNARVIPGEAWSGTSVPAWREEHPAARSPQYARWVMRWWGHGVVCDPFAGTGTLLVAAKTYGLPSVGIELQPRYCEIAVQRLRQEVLPFTAPPRPVEQLSL